MPEIIGLGPRDPLISVDRATNVVFAKRSHQALAVAVVLVVLLACSTPSRFEVSLLLWVHSTVSGQQDYVGR